MISIQIDNTEKRESKYLLEEHKWPGWYWVSEEQCFMRWNDMMDYYNEQS
jgi:hypothetical protein|tara:strand:+ start:55 stop:204 length:150 start_codon:yes stop_codon:yes gene_type:complete